MALTFDDGPTAETAAIADRLAAAGARATFFLLGSRIQRHGDVVARLVATGHEVASHGWSHARLEHRPIRAVFELARTTRAIRAASGERPVLFRPPYGGWSPRLAAAVGIAGLRPVTWDVDPRDWESREPGAVAAAALGSARGGSIVLLHDAGNGVALAAVDDIVAGLRKRGLEPTTVSRLLSMDG